VLYAKPDPVDGDAGLGTHISIRWPKVSIYSILDGLKNLTHDFELMITPRSKLQFVGFIFRDTPIRPSFPKGLNWGGTALEEMSRFHRTLNLCPGGILIVG